MTKGLEIIIMQKVARIVAAAKKKKEKIKKKKKITLRTRSPKRCRTGARK
jgi:hypothetical protein